MTSNLGPYTPGFNVTHECGVYQGDARVLAQSIPDECIDMLFTDPVYDQMADYTWLAELGQRILISGGVCLVWTGIHYLPQVTAAMTALDFRWAFASMLPRGKRGSFAQYRMFSNWRCLLWYEKGKSKLTNFCGDVFMESDNRYTGRKGWGKSLVTTRKLLNAFAPAAVVDPFCGGGTVPVACKELGLSYLAFDNDDRMVKMTRKRVRQAQLPLFPVTEQLMIPALEVAIE